MWQTVVIGNDQRPLQAYIIYRVVVALLYEPLQFLQINNVTNLELVFLYLQHYVCGEIFM